VSPALVRFPTQTDKLIRTTTTNNSIKSWGFRRCLVQTYDRGQKNTTWLFQATPTARFPASCKSTVVNNARRQTSLLQSPKIPNSSRRQWSFRFRISGLTVYRSSVDRDPRRQSTKVKELDRFPFVAGLCEDGISRLCPKLTRFLLAVRAIALVLKISQPWLSPKQLVWEQG